MVDLLSFGVLPGGGLEALQVTVDRVGGAAAVGQGRDHKVGAVDVVAAGEQAAAAGAVVVADSNQVAALVRVQAGRRLLQQVVGAVADGEDDGVGRDRELGAGDGLRAAAPRLVGVPQAHALAVGGGDVAVLAHEAGGRGEVLELDALFAGVAALLLPAFLLVLGAAVHAGDALRAQAHGGADAVHGGIAAADDEDVPAERRGFAHLLRELVGLQVAAHQELRGLVAPGQLLAGDAHLAADAGAGADEDGVEAVGEHIVDRYVAADPGVADELDADAAQEVELLGEDLLAHLEVGDAVEEDAARLRPGLEHGAGVTDPGELFGYGQGGGPGADDGDLLSAGRRQLRQREALRPPLVVRDERLQLADGHRRLAAPVRRAGGEADDAGALAEGLLGAEAAAHLGEVGGLTEDVGGGDDVAALQEEERAGYVVVYGAGFLAGGGGAVDAALGLDDGGIEVIAEEGLVPVLDPLRGVLFGGGLDRYLQAAVVLAGQAGTLRKPATRCRWEGGYSLPEGVFFASGRLLNAPVQAGQAKRGT